MLFHMLVQFINIVGQLLINPLNNFARFDIRLQIDLQINVSN